MSRPVYIKKTIGGMIFDICNTLLMCLMFFIMLYPFWNQLVLSFNEGTDATRGGIYFWPRAFSLLNYRYMFGTAGLLKGAMISLLRVAAGTASNLFCSGILAYVVSLRTFPGRRAVRLAAIISMYIPVGLIPVYILYSGLGLLDTFHVYWIPSLISVWNMLMISSYIMNQPESLIESARLDGAREWQIYIRIIFPICIPVFAALAVITSVSHWNSWFDVMVFNPSGEWDTLQMYLRKILLKSDQINKMLDDAAKMAELRKLAPRTIRATTTMIVTIPIVCVYPFMQKYFISGISIGAVKG